MPSTLNTMQGNQFVNETEYVLRKNSNEAAQQQPKTQKKKKVSMYYIMTD